MGEYHFVAKASEIPVGKCRMVEISGKQIALFNVSGNYYAIDELCTHRGGPLSEGTLEGTQVVCPWHGACFDITSGKLLSGPTNKDLKSYPVRVQADSVQIEV